MIVTINTDASFSPSAKVGTYAYWIVCNAGKIKKSGMLKYSINDPTEAEMKCIVNAFHEVAANSLVVPLIKKIVVNTDSMNAIHVLTNNMPAKIKYKLIKKHYKAIHRVYKKIVATHFPNADIVFTHVKAHDNTDSARNFVNDWLDKAAKQELSNYHIKQKQHANINNIAAVPEPHRRSANAVG